MAPSGYRVFFSWLIVFTEFSWDWAGCGGSGRWRFSLPFGFGKLRTAPRPNGKRRRRTATADRMRRYRDGAVDRFDEDGAVAIDSLVDETFFFHFLFAPRSFLPRFVLPRPAIDSRT